MNCNEVDKLFEPTTETLTPEEVARLRQLATESLRAVRPLPRDGVLVGLILLVFVVFCVGAASIYKMYAVRLAPSMKLGIFLSVLITCTVAATFMTVQEMIPGSRRRLQPDTLVTVIAAGLLVTAFILFPNFDAKGFLKAGPGCLRAGSICAAIAATVLLLSTAKYSFGSVLRTALTTGVVSGLAGVTVLTLHCPLWTIPHVVVWHFGVLIVGLGLGAALGAVLRLVKQKSRARVRNF